MPSLSSSLLVLLTGLSFFTTSHTSVDATARPPADDSCDPRVTYLDSKYGQFAQDQIDSFHAVLEYVIENPASWEQDVFEQVTNGFHIGMTLVDIFMNIPSDENKFIQLEACTSFGSFRSRAENESNGILTGVSAAVGAVFNRRNLRRGKTLVGGILKRTLGGGGDEETRKLAADGLDILMADYLRDLVSLLEMYNDPQAEEVTFEYFGWAYNQVSSMACRSCSLAKAMANRLGQGEPNICGEDAAWLRCNVY